MVAAERKISAVTTLLFMTPLVAEYLLGDLPLKLPAALSSSGLRKAWYCRR
jgi:hypothetical protein